MKVLYYQKKLGDITQYFLKNGSLKNLFIDASATAVLRGPVQAYLLTSVITDFRSFFFFSLCSLLLTHFVDTPEAEFFSPSYFGITRRNIN